LANIFFTMSTSDERDEHGSALASDDSTTPVVGSASFSSEAPPDVALLPSAIGSGLLARQPTPQADETIAVTKLCPQCGSEYETGDRFCPRDGSPLRPKSGGDPLIGRVIADRYLVLARLGEGGMGRVYLAEHVKMTRQCAIKVMNPALMNDSESLARFAREASSAARILHPNVAAVFDYGEADKIVYLVMEYVDGRSLSSILTDGPLDPRRAIDIARQIADGLSAAHDLGIVHRDLKPDNVIVSSARSGKETPKVVDFGIAKALSDSPQDALTRSGLVIGTPEYMSPEQLLGDPVDPRADIYSLGCILYQMLTGEQPFAAESREQMIRRRLHEAPPHVRDVLPELPRRLDTLIVHMLSRSPAERLASAAEVRDALDPSLALSGWDPSAIGGPRSNAHTVHEPIRKHGDPSLQPTMPMPRQRSNVMRLVAGGAGGGVVLVAAIVAWSQRGGAAVAPARAADSTRLSAPTAGPLPLPVATPKDSLVKLDSSTLKKPKPVAPTPDELVRRPFSALNDAIKTGNSQVLSEKFPMLPPATKTFLSSLYLQYDNVRCNTTYGQAAISGDHADLPVTLRIRYSARGSGAPSSTNLPLLAKLVRHGEKWQIDQLLPRT
jgi:serine/threonine protein kinase